jgi:hypothetical protein
MAQRLTGSCYYPAMITLAVGSASAANFTFLMICPDGKGCPLP